MHPTKEIPAARDKLLFTPGPLTTSQTVKQAMLRDAGSWHADFNALVAGVRSRLLGVAGLTREQGWEAVLMQGSGTFGVEAVFQSCVPPDGQVVVLANGAYGERMAQMLKHARITHRVLRTAEDAPADAAALDSCLAGDPAVTHVAVVHGETTTGLLNPIESIGRVAKHYGKTYVVDAMSTFGGMPIDIEACGIDFLISSSNKCIEGVPGFSFVLCRREALVASEGWARSLSLDLLGQLKGFEKDGKFRYTPPTHVILAFDQALRELELEGGVPGRHERYRRNHATLLAGMERLGLETYLNPNHQGPMITAFLCPSEKWFDFDRFYAELSRLGFIIYPGKLTQVDTFRIGNIGRLFPADMEQLVAAIGSVFVKCRMHDFTLNGRAYSPPPAPTVVICLDGSADEYLDTAMARGRMPNLLRLSARGYRGFARGAMPSLTNVNNSSIVTGAPPRIHGIGGNYFFDTASGKEVMMNSASFLRAETIFPAAQRAGRRVAVVTAKEKLRDIFASGLIGLGGIAFSSEKAREAKRGTHGIDAVESVVGPTPPIYSGEASLYVLKAGVKLIERGAADFLYLSTTDFMQHKFAPEAPEAVEFYAGLDEQLGHLLALGALVGITADHGMNAKQKADGSPNVIYLESELVRQFGPGFRVILPITDPYVAHHGALGSFAQVHLPPGKDLAVGVVAAFLRQVPGVTEVLERDCAARWMELPEDRMGDVVVCSGRDVVLGRTPQWHDLTVLENGLRSHGGRYEEMVPFILSAPLKADYAARARGDARNFDIFDFTCNGTL